jgi:hypothetical protein
MDKSLKKARKVWDEIIKEQRTMLEIGGYGGSNTLILQHLTVDVVPRHFAKALRQTSKKALAEPKRIIEGLMKYFDPHGLHGQEVRDAKKFLKTLAKDNPHGEVVTGKMKKVSLPKYLEKFEVEHRYCRVANFEGPAGYGSICKDHETGWFYNVNDKKTQIGKILITT